MSTDVQLSKWQKFRKTVFWEYTQVIVVALILVFGFIRPFVVEAFKIPSGSMEDTLLVGDRILVCKFIYGFKIPGTDIRVFDFHKPARGDVFVFIPPHEEDRNFIKRIVAIEGDTVHTEGKTLYVNGKAVDDSAYTKHVGGHFSRRNDFPPFRQMQEYMRGNELYHDYTKTDSQFKREFPEGKPFTVPKRHVFAIGDNRNNSQDSRTWGPVPVDRIKGQAFMVYWSFCNDKDRHVECKNENVKIWEVWKIIGNIRFNRIGKLIHSQHGFN
ncbi:MAG: signal peptidase I [Candidatus Poribacteria bacterium]|nr:signal peptidase I [Candidatus Poribacteria bacterium]MDE0317572.1 signal peptidase I [Candidatus Poribacteria bacterium]MDE0483629.1 signal peptidase I [Candidatus Poribacteria bacterium]